MRMLLYMDDYRSEWIVAELACSSCSGDSVSSIHVFHVSSLSDCETYVNLECEDCGELTRHDILTFY